MTDFAKEYDSLRERYGTDGDRSAFLEGILALRARSEEEAVEHWSLLLSGRLAGEEDRYDEELEAYGELVERYHDSANLDEQMVAALALLRISIRVAPQGKGDEAVAIYEKVAKRFGEAEQPAIREAVASALVNMATALGWLGKPDKAVDACEEVIERFGDAEEPAIKERVVRALVCKALALVQQGESGQARQALESAQRLRPEDEFVRQAAAFVLGADRREAEGYLPKLLGEILEAFPKDKQEAFAAEMEEREKRTHEFLAAQSSFPSGPDSPAILLDLREWNSYTPAVPDKHEIDRGGGYFIRYKGQGIVVDPGYDFIRNFDAADGRIHDIDHIVITHAHNDHTQDFESLLSLMHEYNDRHTENPKRVCLYLSQGAARKFSGHLPLRDVPYIGRIEILNQGSRDHPQTVSLHGLPGAKLTVLRAFHDDVITLDYSVGLGFEFRFGKETKTVVFTGDSGLFPPKRNDKGEVERRPDGSVLQDIDDRQSQALYNHYPRRFQRPDVLVLHIGSIKQAEFRTDWRATGGDEEGEEGLYFYPDHLGLRGSVTMLDRLRPRIAIMSEYGEELKSIRFDLARGVGELLEKRRGREDDPVFVVPGDLTVVYDIGEDKFLCHDTKEFHSPSEVQFREVAEPEQSRFYSRGIERTYIFRTPPPDGATAASTVETFHVFVKHHGEPYARGRGK